MPLEQQNFVYVDIHMDRLTLCTAAGKATNCYHNSCMFKLSNVYTVWFSVCLSQKFGSWNIAGHDKHYPLKESACIERLDVFCQWVWGLELKHAHVHTHTLNFQCLKWEKLYDTWMKALHYQTAAKTRKTSAFVPESILSV